MDCIVYESNTGFTKQYAEALGERIGLPVYHVTEAIKTVSQGSEIFFLGWVCAGKISGLAIVDKRFVVAGIAAVGIIYPSPEILNQLAKTNVINCPMYYLQGGVDPKKLSFMKRKVLSMIAKNMEMHQAKTSADFELVDALRNGGSFVDLASIEPIAEWIEGSRDTDATQGSEPDVNKSAEDFDESYHN